MKFRYLLSVMSLLFILQNSDAQVKTYSLKKGQSFDILFFNTLPESKDILNKYFQTAIPVAQEYGYMPQKGFNVTENLRGNYQPSTMILALWSDYQKRKSFITEVETKVPNFHEMRRAIWSTFFLTYWEIKEDKTVEVDSEKFNVLTAYWSEGQKAFNQFKEQWKNEAQQSNGELILELTDGASPLGYYYNPDYLTITSWESREAFEDFYSKNLKMDHTGVRHVNQFVIE